MNEKVMMGPKVNITNANITLNLSVFKKRNEIVLTMLYLFAIEFFTVFKK